MRVEAGGRRAFRPSSRCPSLNCYNVLEPPDDRLFSLVVHGATLVEPTETESKAGLDQFIGALRSVAERAKAGDQSLKTAPHFAPRRRLDETAAARSPVLAQRYLADEDD